jgi:hypothetical protein
MPSGQLSKPRSKLKLFLVATGAAAAIFIIIFSVVPLKTVRSASGVCANNMEKHYGILTGDLTEFKHDSNSVQSKECEITDTLAACACSDEHFDTGRATLKLYVFQ